MERFWFEADAQWAPIGTLSGGERRRLQLLLVLAALPNVLLLDEPSNDLELDTLRAIEDHLESWAGSLVVVSHDRAFLERTVEDVLVLDGRGGAAMASNGYAAYEAARRAAPTDASNLASRPATAPSATRSLAGSPSAGGTKKLRSPSTVRRLLDRAGKELEAATAERDRLTAELNTVASDHVALSALADRLAAAEHALADIEHRWLELAEELGA